MARLGGRACAARERGRAPRPPCHRCPRRPPRPRSMARVTTAGWRRWLAGPRRARRQRPAAAGVAQWAAAAAAGAGAPCGADAGGGGTGGVVAWRAPPPPSRASAHAVRHERLRRDDPACAAVHQRRCPGCRCVIPPTAKRGWSRRCTHGRRYVYLFLECVHGRGRWRWWVRRTAATHAQGAAAMTPTGGGVQPLAPACRPSQLTAPPTPAGAATAHPIPPHANPCSITFPSRVLHTANARRAATTGRSRGGCQLLPAHPRAARARRPSLTWRRAPTMGGAPRAATDRWSRA